jgi:hypothetical protein
MVDADLREPEPCAALDLAAADMDTARAAREVEQGADAAQIMLDIASPKDLAKDMGSDAYRARLDAVLQEMDVAEGKAPAATPHANVKRAVSVFWPCTQIPDNVDMGDQPIEFREIGARTIAGYIRPIEHGAPPGTEYMGYKRRCTERDYILIPTAEAQGRGTSSGHIVGDWSKGNCKGTGNDVGDGPNDEGCKDYSKDDDDDPQD